jgi:hypothetical protein
MRVVDLDIGASKSDICAIRVVTILERRQNSSLQPRVGVETAMENVESTGRPATDRQNNTKVGGEIFPATNAQMCAKLRYSAVAYD